ncbi:MAG: hypothetical protein ABW275_12115 [Hansschlegelia sp.]
MPYNIIIEGGRKRIHHARTAREALDYAISKRAEHPDLKIVSNEGTVLEIDRLELMARAEEAAPPPTAHRAA